MSDENIEIIEIDGDKLLYENTELTNKYNKLIEKYENLKNKNKVLEKNLKSDCYICSRKDTIIINLKKKLNNVNTEYIDIINRNTVLEETNTTLLESFNYVKDYNIEIEKKYSEGLKELSKII